MSMFQRNKEIDAVIAAEDVDEEKIKGNECFKAGSFRQAISHYSKAIDAATFNISAVSPDALCALYSNRALARIRAGDADGAESDCDRALMIRPTFLKAIYRRALARKLMCQLDSAIADLKFIISCPEATSAEIQDAKKVMTEIDSELATLRLQEEVVYQRLKNQAASSHIEEQLRIEEANAMEDCSPASSSHSLQIPSAAEQKSTIDSLMHRAGPGCAAVALLPQTWYRAWTAYLHTALSDSALDSGADSSSHHVQPILMRPHLQSSAENSAYELISEFQSISPWKSAEADSQKFELRSDVIENVNVIAVPRIVVEQLAEWFSLDFLVCRAHLSSVQCAELDPLRVRVQLDSEVQQSIYVACSRQDSLDFLRKTLCSKWLLSTLDCRWMHADRQLISDSILLIGDAVMSANKSNLSFASIEKQSLSSEVTLVLQCRLPNGNWPATAASDVVAEISTSLCLACKQPSVHKCSKCKVAKYCTVRCQRAHWPFHRKRCGREADSAQRDGRVGFVNLGNTCFMNAALQTLLRAKELVSGFISDSYVSDLNNNNPLGHQGRAAEAFAALCKSAHFDFDPVIAPRAFLSELTSMAPQFGGRQQHDAQEFLSWLLDALHEDTNRVLNKPYIQYGDSANRPDAEVADEFWRGHMQRNQSVLQDLFGGQEKSALQCPECEFESTRFDPFYSLSLPLPPLHPRILNVQLFLRLPDPQSSMAFFPEAVAALGAILADAQLDPAAIELVQAACAISPSQLLFTLPVSPLATLAQVKEQTCARIREMVAQHIKPALLQLEKLPLPADAPEERARNIGTVVQALRHAANACQRLSVGTLTATVTAGHRFTKIFNDARQVSVGVREDEVVTLFEVQCASLSKRTERSIQQIRFLFRRGDALFGTAFAYDWKSSEMTGKALHQGVAQYLRRVASVSTDDIKLYTVDKVGLQCSTCTTPCRGCLVPDTAELLPLSDRQFIAVEVSSDIDWNDDAPVFAEATNQIEREFVTLQDCLDLYTSSEKLSSDEGWYCSKCKTHVPASKKVDLWRLGPIVALNLKRFHFQDGRAVKISTPVHFPLADLQLSPYLPHAVPSYDLFATLNHHGIAGYGHYTANVCDIYQQWWSCDDDLVSKISADEVVSKSAYVLLYRRREN